MLRLCERRDRRSSVVRMLLVSWRRLADVGPNDRIGLRAQVA
jgi:hypothetical protein